MDIKLTEWDKKFLNLAKHIATWSKDFSTQVGAVIAKENRIIATGYNGLPHGLRDSIINELQKKEGTEYARTFKNRHTIHAEANAIKYATQCVRGTNLYITHPPCTECARMIVDKGIGVVYAIASDDERFCNTWGCESVDDVLGHNHIPLILVTEEELNSDL